MFFSPIAKPISIDELPFVVKGNSITDFVSKIDDSSWMKFDFRQKVFKAHQATSSIPILWIPLDIQRFSPELQQPHPVLYQTFLLISNTLLAFLEQHYNGKIFKILLTKLKGFSEIPPHTDHGFSLEYTHRVHIPIITNDKILFTVNNNILNMKKGHLYEINNKSLHGVANLSNIDRIHLIIDVIENRTIEESRYERQ